MKAVTITLDIKMPAVLLSMKPNYANAVLDDEKSIELRRVNMARIPDVGTLAFLYASAPVSGIVGVARIWPGMELPPTYRTYPSVDMRLQAAVTLGEWKDYAPRWVFPVEPLRSCPRVDIPNGWRPPQSFRYISAGDFPLFAMATGLVTP